MRRFGLILAAVAVVLGYGGATTGSTRAASQWQVVTTQKQASTTQVGTLRVGKTLFVAWTRQLSSHKYQLLVSTVGATGEIEGS